MRRDSAGVGAGPAHCPLPAVSEGASTPGSSLARRPAGTEGEASLALGMSSQAWSELRAAGWAAHRPDVYACLGRKGGRAEAGKEGLLSASFFQGVTQVLRSPWG